MKYNRFMYLFCVLCTILLVGCTTASISPLSPHFANNFSEFKTPEKNTVKEKSLKMNFQNPYDSVWDGVLTILSQNTIIVDVSKESGLITFVDIDGIMIKKKFYNWEFPFTVLVEENKQEITVYIHSMVSLFETDKRFSENKWWETIKAGFDQKGQEFLEKLSVQLASSSRWPWLTR